MAAETGLHSATLAVTTIDFLCKNVNTCRTAGIEIRNRTKYELRKPRYFLHSGYCQMPPNPIIRPNHKEGTVFSKRPDVAYGTAGVLVYSIYKSPGDFDDDRDQVCDLAIMFSAPYDRWGYENKFAIDLYKNIEESKQTFEDMYKADKFEKKRSTGDMIKIRDCGFQVTATMSSDSEEQIVLVLRDMRKPPQSDSIQLSSSNPSILAAGL